MNSDIVCESRKFLKESMIINFIVISFFYPNSHVGLHFTLIMTNNNGNWNNSYLCNDLLGANDMVWSITNLVQTYKNRMENVF